MNRAPSRARHDIVPLIVVGLLVVTYVAIFGTMSLRRHQNLRTNALDLGSATRVYWTFKVLGHDKVSILDGGYRAYTADPANPVEAGWVEPLPDIFSADFRPEMVADPGAHALSMAPMSGAAPL